MRKMRQACSDHREGIPKDKLFYERSLVPPPLSLILPSRRKAHHCIIQLSSILKVFFHAPIIDGNGIAYHLVLPFISMTYGYFP